MSSLSPAHELHKILYRMSQRLSAFEVIQQSETRNDARSSSRSSVSTASEARVAEEHRVGLNMR
jgi:hypothetical protein